MNVLRLLDLHNELCAEAAAIMEAKNHDYSSSGGDDCFRNFRSAELLGIDAKLGLLIRVLDKIQRLRTFAQTGTLAVNNESFRDAVLDIINYMVLFAGMVEEERTVDQDAPNCGMPFFA